jgi:hypothetical protein
MPSIRKQITYPIELAWAAVCGADRINLQEYYNQNTYSSNQVKFNKVIAYELLAEPENIQPEDKEFGAKMAEHFKGLLFRTLTGGTQNGFLDTIANIVAKEEVSKFDVACMAALPKVYRKDLTKEIKTEKQQALASTSEYIGTIGSKQELAVEIIDSIYSRNYNIYINTATDGANVIKFTTVHDATVFPQGEKIRIKGAVKKQEINNRTGAKETWLTRVKRV